MVKNAVEDAMTEIVADVKLEAGAVLAEIAKLAFVNMRDLFGPAWKKMFQ